MHPSTGVAGTVAADRLWPAAPIGRRFGVLFGGTGPEWGLALESATWVIAALEARGCHVVPIGMNAAGHWRVQSPEDAPSEPDWDGAAHATGADVSRLDVIVNVVQGDYPVQAKAWALLKRFARPVVSNPLVSQRIARNKQVVKRLLRAIGILTPDWECVATALELTELLRRQYRRFPLMVKPVDGGDSVLVRYVSDTAGLQAACAEILAHHRTALVETYIDGKELSSGILGDATTGRLVNLGLVEIGHAGLFFDEEIKTRGLYRVEPARAVPAAVADLAHDIAMKTHLRLRCRAFSRMDFILSEKGLYALEINSNPGLAAKSIIPAMIGACGLEFGEVLMTMANNAWLP